VSSLGERTWMEQQQRGRRTLLVPVGSFEQHGSHLPLTTDTIVATTVCNDVATVRDVDVAPAFPYGASGEHEGFWGLLSLGTDATAQALVELVRSARASWSRLVFVSGHGGNFEALHRVVTVAQVEGDDVLVWFPTDHEGDAHAGVTETSVLLSVDPALVREERAVFAAPEGWMAQARRSGVRAISPTGVLGDPSDATAERGRTLRARWCGEVVALVDRPRRES